MNKEILKSILEKYGKNNCAINDYNTTSQEQNTSDFDDMLYEMASVGYFCASPNKNDRPQLKVFVNGGEGNIPHMHIWDDDTNGKRFHTCVCLNKVEYFHHNGKENVLSQKQKENLIVFLKSECLKNKRYKTNWEYALSMWNDNNTDKTQVDESSDVLDYMKL